jgi:hypothetical protein
MFGSNKNNFALKEAIEQDADFFKLTIDYEKYALVFSKELSKILDNTNDDDVKDQSYWEGLVKISPNDGKGNPVYRLCRAYNGVKSGQIALGFRTRKNLSPNKESQFQVRVEKASWFCYMWCNMSSEVRYSFRFAVIGLLLSFLGILISIFI